MGSDPDLILDDFALLQGIVDSRDHDERVEFLYEHPRLLVPGVAEQLAAARSYHARGWRARLALRTALMFVRAGRAQAEARPDEYPFGPGPVEAIWRRKEQGEISAEHAARLAAHPDIARSLAPPYAEVLTRHAGSTALAGKWREAVEFDRLLVAAAAALPEADWANRVRETVVVNSLNVALLALVRVPDGRLLREARANGEQMLERTRAAGDAAASARILYELGILHLDPYTAGRDPHRLDDSFARWEQRIVDEYGDDLLVVPEGDWRMPSPRDALMTAETYLREAADASTARQRGIALEGLATALYFRRAMGETVDRAEIVASCREALKLLAPSNDEALRGQAETILREIGEPVAAPSDSPPLLDDLDEMEARLGTGPAVDLVERHVRTLELSAGPQAALELVRRARPLFRRQGDEAYARALHNELVLVDAVAAPVPTFRPQGGVAAAAAAVRAHATEQSFDSTLFAATLIAVARRAGAWRDPEDGLQLLAEAEAVSPVLASASGDALRSLAAELRLGAAERCVREGDPVAALRSLAAALEDYLDLDLGTRGLDVLQRIRQVAVAWPDDLPAAQDPTEAALARDAIIETIAPHALRLEVMVGEPAGNLLRALSRDLVVALIGRPATPELLFFAWRLAKGLRFAAALARRPRYRIEDDPRGSALLEEIARAGATGASSEEGVAVFDEELALSAYVREADLAAGESAEEVLANLRQTFDDHVNGVLNAAAQVAGSGGLTVDEVQRLIDERTVVLDVYLGIDADDRVTSYVLLMTSDDIRIAARAIGQPGEHLVWTTRDGRRLQHGPLSLWVADQRQAIQEEPFGRSVSTAGGRALERAVDQLLGSGNDMLADLRKQGRDHLCVVPHGPLHYYPLHLAGVVDHPLADTWTVTYLPNLALLGRVFTGGGARRERALVTAVGLDFQELAGEGADLTHAASESRLVAELFGVEPVLDAQATKGAVIEGLEGSRYVHLATHGAHVAHAPALQSIFLAHDDDSGRLSAFEVYALDLDGLELLTLSACETALGRFDTSDNLRGLPASFFVAGAKAIVGTLWPVEDATSETFFTSMYRTLAADGTPLDAFAAAQRETRNLHPEYRDWGAFVFQGEWR